MGHEPKKGGAGSCLLQCSMNVPFGFLVSVYFIHKIKQSIYSKNK